MKLISELNGHVLRCVRDQNGNHVIQKCIESIPMEKIKFVISSFRGQVAALSTHPYGCRVIQVQKRHSELIFYRSFFFICFVLTTTVKCPFDLTFFCCCCCGQRVLEHSTDELQSQFIVNEILESVYTLAQDQYGNYVTQVCFSHF